VNGEKMSKSLGNVIYTADVTAKGFTGEQLRFYLIYGAYREEMDFTFEKLSRVSQQLNALRSMITDLQASKQPREKCQGDSYVGRLTSEFEAHMDNDLDVKGAFDTLTETVTQVHKNRKTLSAEEIKNVLSDLHRIDTVLMCLF
jgi:cysteinyl-tRNA synthetase